MPDVFDPVDVERQLIYSGVMAALLIRRSGYPTRLVHLELLKSFWRLQKFNKRKQLQGR